MPLSLFIYLDIMLLFASLAQEIISPSLNWHFRSVAFNSKFILSMLSM